MAAEFENIPVLDGWVNLTEAAEMVGITRQHAHKKARLANDGKPNGWKTIHRIGSKPAYVVSLGEVESLIAAQSKISGQPTWLTDEDLATTFKYGMSVTEEDLEDAVPVRGLAEPSLDSGEVFALWFNEFSETYFPREVEKVGGSYRVVRNGVRYKLFPLPESRKVVF